MKRETKAEREVKGGGKVKRSKKIGEFKEEKKVKSREVALMTI